tara:strand:- start:984 stop:2108 length:1125 start_codon:yes stop_codon:yes gene_type:complete
MSVTSSLKTYYINIAPDKKYPIIFGENAYLSISKKDLGDATKVLIVTNDTIYDTHDEFFATLEQHLDCDVEVFVLDDGESHKSLDSVSEILNACISHDMGRKDVLIAVGGGVVGDLAGFAASIYLRGIPLIQMPTSLLAQVDAAIGGKTGANHPNGKNLIGTFYQPIKTIIDPLLLATLPNDQMKEGLAEIIKYGVIMDKPLFWYIEQHLAAIKTFSYEDCPDVWHFLIEKSIQNKALIVSQDEKEAEVRETLNFGHTIAHAIESVFNYDSITHGEAVAMGMMVESLMSHNLRHLSEENLHRIQSLIQSFDFKLTLPSIDQSQFLAALKRDKKNRKGLIRFVLPTDIGQTKTVSGIANDTIFNAMNDQFDGVIQ